MKTDRWVGFLWVMVPQLVHKVLFMNHGKIYICEAAKNKCNENYRRL